MIIMTRATGAATWRFTASILVASLWAASLTQPALATPANPAAGADSSGLEEIVVTAEKRNSTVQATPISITALSASDLAEQNIATVED